MNTKNARWLSKKIDNKEAFYEFLTTSDKRVIEYVSNACYKKRFVDTNRLFNELVQTINNDTLTSYRTLPERMQLINRALDVYNFPHLKTDDAKFKMLMDMVISEELLNLNGSTFMGSIGCQLILMDEASSMSSPLNNEEKIKLMYAKKMVALSKLSFRAKLEFMEKISSITDNNKSRLESKVYDINRIVSNEEFTTDPNLCRFLLDSVISNYDIDYGKSYNSSMLTTSKLNNMMEEFNNSLTKEISKSKQTTPTIEEKIEEYLKLEDIKNKDLKTKVKK